MVPLVTTGLWEYKPYLDGFSNTTLQPTDISLKNSRTCYYHALYCVIPVFFLHLFCCVIMNITPLRPRPNGRYFADDILNEKVSLKISLKIVPMVRISNIPALVQIMAWCRPGDKPLSESMMISLPTHICVNRPQWVHHFILSLQTISMWELHNDYATGQTVGGHWAIGWRLL